MRRSIATVSLSGTLDEKLAAIAAARFDAVEIFENDLLYYFGRPREVRDRAASLGLGIDLYQPFRDFEGAPEALFHRNMERAERKFDVMQELGAPMMLLCSNVSPQSLGDRSRIVDQLSALAELAGRRNIQIGFEALAWGRHTSHFGQAWEIVRAVDHPNLGIILDSFHMLSLGDSPAGIRDIPAEKIFFVQLADAPRLAMDVLQWSRHFRCFPGQGGFDLPEFMEEVLSTGYSGPISLEIFNDVFRATPTRRTAVDAMQSLLYLEEQTALRIAGRNQTAAKPVVPAVDLFTPPPPPEFDGVAFVEFAVEGAVFETLATLLTALGFRQRGRHRSKAVTLFEQGDIRLIINAEPGSFAHSFFLMHGLSVCAIALRTADERTAIGRASSFHCKKHEGKIGSHESQLLSIRALDGSLIYFVPAVRADAIISTDFILNDDLAPGGQTPAGIGLTKIDHIAQALPPGDLDTWVLFYRAVLGLKAGDSWELADPYGIVQSRAVASDNRSVRIPMNISRSNRTTPAQAISALAGGGVHHIAFQSDDIFKTVEALQGGAVELLPISDNYYDDLPNRFVIAPDLVDRLRQGNILYDADENGEFLHAYTEVFADRLFLEIVERRGGYDGYGAPNAAARLASQAQNRPSSGA